MNTSIIFIILGVICTSIGGLIAFARMTSFREESIKLSGKNNRVSAENQKLINSNTALSSNSVDLTSQNQMLINQNIELSQKTQELAQTVNEITAKVREHQTGGDSYLKISLNDFDSETTKTLVAYGHVVGEYPIYNISIQYQQLSKLGEESNRMYHFKFESLPPNKTVPLGRVPIPINGEFGRYSFSIFARNGNVENWIWVYKGEGKFSSWTQVFSDFTLKEKIDESIQKDFPKNKEGKPIWPPAAMK